MAETMKISITAPNRIDLAGGTTDLYPLCLLMEGGCTVNAALTMSSHVTMKSLGRRGVKIVSDDLGQTLEAPEPSELPLEGPLGLVARAVRCLPPPEGVEIRTRNEAPKGSGLGASSSLVVAVLKGLLKLRDQDEPPEKLIRLAVNVETANLGVPAGSQDHIAAVFGGISLIDFSVEGFSRRSVPLDSGLIEALEERVVLSYTGEGRFSGMNNWEITKRYIDGQKEVRETLVSIRDLARAMGDALLAGDFDAVPHLLSREWNLRRSLAPGISTPRIEAIMAAAQVAGAQGSKICGAGGGGCMVTMVPSRRRAQVQRAIEAAGGQVIQAGIDRQGLRLRAFSS